MFLLDHQGHGRLPKIRTRDGSWLYLLVLLEFQSTIDRRMAMRMLNYTMRILEGLGEDELGPGGAYPPILPVVIYNGERLWSAATNLRDLFAPVPEQLLGYLPRHRYLLIDLRALDPSPALRTWNREEGPMSTLAERVKKWGDELNQQWLQKGIEQGIELGRREGAERVRHEGLERERALVRRLAVRRFGPGISTRLGPLLAELSDPDRIAAIADGVLECKTVDEFLARAKEA